MMRNVLEEPMQRSVMAQLPSRNLLAKRIMATSKSGRQSSCEEDFH